MAKFHDIMKNCPESFIDRFAHFTNVDGGKRGLGTLQDNGGNYGS
jgi:hypothetical protein